MEQSLKRKMKREDRYDHTFHILYKEGIFAVILYLCSSLELTTVLIHKNVSKRIFIFRFPAENEDFQVDQSQIQIPIALDQSPIIQTVNDEITEWQEPMWMSSSGIENAFNKEQYKLEVLNQQQLNLEQALGQGPITRERANNINKSLNVCKLFNAFEILIFSNFKHYYTIGFKLRLLREKI